MKLSSSQCCEIAKYAGQHSTAEAAYGIFLEKRVSESTKMMKISQSMIHISVCRVCMHVCT